MTAANKTDTPDPVPAVEVGKIVASLSKMGSDKKEEESTDKA
mgnify:CR=1 FL=1